MIHSATHNYGHHNGERPIHSAESDFVRFTLPNGAEVDVRAGTRPDEIVISTSTGTLRLDLYAGASNSLRVQAPTDWDRVHGPLSREYPEEEKLS